MGPGPMPGIPSRICRTSRRSGQKLLPPGVVFLGLVGRRWRSHMHATGLRAFCRSRRCVLGAVALCLRSLGILGGSAARRFLQMVFLQGRTAFQQSVHFAKCLKKTKPATRTLRSGSPSHKVTSPPNRRPPSLGTRSQERCQGRLRSRWRTAPLKLYSIYYDITQFFGYLIFLTVL